MSNFLTTKQLQEILKVDRTTIYRMADSGRVPGIKVGNQWRFSSQQIEAWLQSQSVGGPVPQPKGNEAPTSAIDLSTLFPLECVQLIQDSFADILGVMILVTDLEGNLLTEPSNPCGLYIAAESSPTSHNRCLELWTRLAQQPSLATKFQKSHLGLLCARGLIRVGSEIQAMLVVGGIAPEVWPPDEAEIQRIASDLDLNPQIISHSIDQVHHLDAEARAKTLPYVQRIADIFAHIANERNELFQRLHKIAEITRM